jgi:hypothetical protein
MRVDGVDRVDCRRPSAVVPGKHPRRFERLRPPGVSNGVVMATAGDPLLYSARFVRTPMIEPGRAGAYLALFGEIGLVLLVTTLAGVLVGYWADQQLGTLPVFVLIGLLAGMGMGALAVRRLINRFLATFDD